MMIKKRVAALVSAGAIGLTTLTGVATAYASSSAAAASCTLRTDQPNAANDATVGRVGCSNTISATGRIKEKRNNVPDDVVGSATFQAGTKLIYGSCGNGYGDYYSEISSSSGAFAQSASVKTCR